MSISRRRFLGQSGWLTAATLGLPPWTESAEAPELRPGQRPGQIIQLVSDGMSWGTLTCADQLSQLLRQRRLVWMQLYQTPGAITAFVNMRSLNSLVTDSAAASSSWGSGSRVVNGVLNQLPDGRNLCPLYQLFGEAGWSRGLVTTTEITHATPAGFAVNSRSRDAAEAIAQHYLERRIEVLLGGGQMFFDPQLRRDKRDLRAQFRHQGYAVFDTLPELNSAPTDRRWLGLFAPSHLPFTLDHQANADSLATVPTLAQMTHYALNRLSRSSRFILQVEGGRIDHASHNCDAAAALRDQIAFDEALEVCLAFQRQAPDTLLVITTDHGTANPTLNGMGKEYSDSVPLFAHLAHIKQSFPEILKQLGAAASPRRIRQTIHETTGYALSNAKANLLASFLDKTGRTLYEPMNSLPAQLGQALANYIGIGWSGTAHTADYVPLVALGPGAERFRGFLQNTDLFRHYLALANIDFRNPHAPLLAESGPPAAAVEPVETYCHEPPLAVHASACFRPGGGTS